MSEEDAPVETAQESIKPVVTLHQAPDQNLVAVAQMADFVGFPLTFYLPWGIASGNTASPNAYYKHLGEKVREGTPPGDAPDWFAEAIDTFASNNFDKYSDIDPTERMESHFMDGFNLLSFIILRNARCWANGFSSAIEHDFLRVRLTDINAWAWGTLA